jgi:hypothetical protein
VRELDREESLRHVAYDVVLSETAVVAYVGPLPPAEIRIRTLEVLLNQVKMFRADPKHPISIRNGNCLPVQVVHNIGSRQEYINLTASVPHSSAS